MRHLWEVNEKISDPYCSGDYADESSRCTEKRVKGSCRVSCPRCVISFNAMIGSARTWHLLHTCPVTNDYDYPGSYTVLFIFLTLLMLIATTGYP